MSGRRNSKEMCVLKLWDVLIEPTLNVMAWRVYVELAWLMTSNMSRRNLQLAA